MGLCLADWPGPAEPERHSTAELRLAILKQLEPRRRLFETATLPSRLADWAPGLAGWDAQEHLADLMAVECNAPMLRNTRRRLRVQGIGVDYPELHDLAALFANSALRSALASFDPHRGEGKEAAWLSTVFYRYALRRVLALRRQHEHFSLAFDVPDTAAAPEEALQQRAREQLLAELPAALAALQPPQRQALALYFGLGGREHTLAELGRAMGTSSYLARAAVQAGLGALAARLGATGLLDAQALNLCRQLFLEGATLEDIARDSGETRASLDRRVKQLGASLRSALRLRTTGEAEPAQSFSGGTEMALMTDRTLNQPAIASAVDAFMARLADGQLAQARELAADCLQQRWADPNGATDHALQSWRQHLYSHPALYEQLLENAEFDGPTDPIAQVFALLERNPAREDLPADHTRLQALVDDLAMHAAVNGEALAALWQEQAAQQGQPLQAEQLRDAGRRLASALSVVSSALEDALPWSARTAQAAELYLSDELEGEWTARWAEGDEPAFSLTALLQHALGLGGGFNAQDQQWLLPVTLQALKDGSAVLPGFAAPVPRQRSPGWTLAWRPARLQRPQVVKR